MSKPFARLGFVMKSLPHGEDGGMATFARFQCVECGQTLDIRVTANIPLNPENLVKKAQRQGWQADYSNKTLCWCPACAGPSRNPVAKVVPMAPPVAPIRDVTPDQRLAIRALLDKHFDDKAGVYLDGQTDDRIAEAVKVPRVHVERIREAAYGPIRVSAEYLECRAELDKLKRAINELTTQVDAAEKKLAALGKGAAA